MASSVTSKQPCVKCDKGGGIAMCSGCQQWFCIKHFNEHRQELAIEMDHVGEEHNLLQRDLSQNNHEHDLLSHVNDWEQKSIAKIQTTAEQVRIDIQTYLDNNKQQRRTFLDRLTDELKASLQSDDYTEIDLKKWLEQLKEIRKMLENPSNIQIIDDNDPQSTIYLIQVKQTSSSTNTLPSLSICEKCAQNFSIENNFGSNCVHKGTWHARYEDCSYLKCGFHLGIKASIGRQHWSCCYSLDQNSNQCSESEPHVAIPDIKK